MFDEKKLKSFFLKISPKTVLDRNLTWFSVLKNPHKIEFCAIGELRYRRSACTKKYDLILIIPYILKYP